MKPPEQERDVDGPERFRLMHPTPLMVLVLFLLGCLIGPALDQIHVLTKTLSYPPVEVFGLAPLLGQPLWVHPQFGVASVIMVVPFYMLLPTFGGAELPQAPIHEVLATFIRFVAMYMLSGLLHDHEWLLTLWIGIAFFLWTIRRRAGWPVYLHAFTCAIGGTAWEATISGMGHFSYDVPHSLFSVPAWLPFLYLHAALWLRSVARALPRRERS